MKIKKAGKAVVAVALLIWDVFDLRREFKKMKESDTENSTDSKK